MQLFISTFASLLLISLTSAFRKPGLLFVVATSIVASATSVSSATAQSNAAFSGVSPPSNIGIALNNIGIYNPLNSTFSTCVALSKIGVPDRIDGVQAFDITFRIVNTNPVLAQATVLVPFNSKGSLTPSLQIPDCSGKFEQQTSIYSDILSVGDLAYEVAFKLGEGQLFELKAAAGLHPGPIIRDASSQSFQRSVNLPGLRIFARDEVSDVFLLNIASAYELIFSPASFSENPYLQEFQNILSNYTIFQRLGYDGPESVRSTMDAVPDLEGDYSRYGTDYIWEDSARTTKRQLGTVLEHLLHTITAVQFPLYWPARWGFESNSELILAMQQAIDLGYYNTEDYGPPSNDLNKILAVEFAWWVILAEWDLFEVAGKDSSSNKEFTLRTSSDIAQKLPLAHKLYTETAAKLFSIPDASILTNLFYNAPYCSSLSETNTPPANLACPSN